MKNEKCYITKIDYLMKNNKNCFSNQIKIAYLMKNNCLHDKK